MGTNPITTPQWVNYTPVILGSTTNPTSPSYSKQSGRYRKDGNIVHFEFDIQVTTLTGAVGQIRVSLPFTSASVATKNTACVIQSGGGGVLGNNANSGNIIASVNYVSLYTQPLTGTVTSLTFALLGVLTNTLTFTGSGWYEV